MTEPCISPDIYRVHRLEKKRVREGNVEFWVKWQGWPARYNTWEPLDNLLDDQLIDDFLLREDKRLGLIKDHKNTADNGEDGGGSNCLESTSTGPGQVVEDVPVPSYSIEVEIASTETGNDALHGVFNNTDVTDDLSLDGHSNQAKECQTKGTQTPGPHLSTTKRNHSPPPGRKSLRVKNSAKSKDLRKKVKRSKRDQNIVPEEIKGKEPRSNHLNSKEQAHGSHQFL